jgi:3-oxoacyl-[acyl-carrier-protein] synthase II
MMSSDPVVITGIGVVSPIGATPDAFWDALMTGSSGAAPVRAFDTSRHRVHIGCEIPPDVDLHQGADGNPTGRTARLAATAGLQAARGAKLSSEDLASTAFCFGTTMGESCWIESWEPGDVVNDTFPAGQLLHSAPDDAAYHAAEILGIGGQLTAVAGACAAGNYAVGLGFDLIRAGRAERVLAGGADAFSRVAFTGFDSLGALARESCRPFSADRDGLVLGEGAGMLLLESFSSAQRRGVTPLGVVAGYGLSCDAHHIVSPPRGGEGMFRAMRSALDDAGFDPASVDWICAHGTGTVANDRAEVAAANALYGNAPDAIRPPMSSIKALTGHGLGAASAIEAVACILAMQHQVIPPTWNLGQTDPDARWDVVADGPRAASVQVALNNSAAFGGNNCAVLFQSPSVLEASR